MFGVPSVWAAESLAKNFTSTILHGVDEPRQAGNDVEPPRRPLSSGSEFAGVGLQLAATIGLGAWLGYWLDRKLGTLPWLTIVLVFLGAGAAFYSIYRRVMAGTRK